MNEPQKLSERERKQSDVLTGLKQSKANKTPCSIRGMAKQKMLVSEQDF
jgi:hypothetical protein